MDGDVVVLDAVPNKFADDVINDVRYDGKLPMVDIDPGPEFNGALSALSLNDNLSRTGQIVLNAALTAAGAQRPPWPLPHMPTPTKKA